MAKKRGGQSTLHMIPLVLGGLAVMFLHGTALDIACIVFGVISLLLGLLMGFGTLRDKSPSQSKIYGLTFGIILVVAGLLLVVFRAEGIRYAAGILLLLGGILFFLLGITYIHDGESPVIKFVFGVIHIVLGILILIEPAFIRDFARYVQGGALIFNGLSLYFFMDTV